MHIGRRLTLAGAGVINYVSSVVWGRSAVGSAPRWHRGGHGFEPRRLHHLRLISESSILLPFAVNPAYQAIETKLLSDHTRSFAGGYSRHIPTRPFSAMLATEQGISVSNLKQGQALEVTSRMAA